MRFDDFLEIQIFVWEIGPSASWNKLFRMALCRWGVSNNSCSMRFCGAKVRPTWRIFAEISDFHKLPFAVKPQGINKSLEKLAGGQVLVENGPLWQPSWSFKVRGCGRNFLKIGNSRKIRKFHGTSGTSRDGVCQLRSRVPITRVAWGSSGGACVSESDQTNI